jgi:hypothetical protein
MCCNLFSKIDRIEVTTVLITMLAPIAALVAALAGITGSAWDKRKRGWRRLTVNGWVIAGVALASFVVSSYQVRKAAISEAKQQAKDALVRGAAAGEIKEAIGELLRPFKLAIDAEKYKAKPSLHGGDVLDRFMQTPVDDLDRIGSADFLNTLSTIPALACPEQFGAEAKCHWADLFVEGAERGDRDLLGIIDRYSGVFDPRTLNLISALRQHKMLSILKSAAGNLEMNQEMGNQVGDVTVGWLLLGPHEPTEYYVPFFNIVRELVKVSNSLEPVSAKVIEKFSPPTPASGSTTPSQKPPQPQISAKQNSGQTSAALQPAAHSPELGKPQSNEDVVKQLRSNAERGDANAQVELGLRYDSGKGVPHDDDEALKWFRLSAAQGNGTAQGILGIAYASGQGVSQNYVEAAKWLRLSAAQGNALSQYSLGVLSEGGQIAAQDSSDAVKWYRLAAAQGYAKAFFNLGVMYDKGEGVKQDYVLAHMWFGFAAESTQTEVQRAAEELYARVTAKMTATQITEAKALAIKCQASKYKDCG